MDGGPMWYGCSLHLDDFLDFRSRRSDRGKFDEAVPSETQILGKFKKAS